MQRLVSIIIPIYNEEENIYLLYEELKKNLENLQYNFEIIFINDGSTDGSQAKLEKIIKKDNRVKIIEFSRNFGKEAATTAGIENCQGEACLILDGDLQHPVELIPEFLRKWENGAEIVVGIRSKNKGEGFLKKIGSYIYYKTINKISETKILPYSTDFRLLDRIVIEAFKNLRERTRMTRALIDWLGFKKEYIYFQAYPRMHGNRGYNYLKLIKLAVSSYISHSLLPLKIAGYLGIGITVFSGALGLFMLINKFFIADPWKMNFSGPAMLATLILFLVGIILISLGLIALYIGNIHIEVQNRPIYIIRKKLTRSK